MPVQEEAVVIQNAALPPAGDQDRIPASRSVFWGRFQALLVTLVVCRGLILLCSLPIFEGWDEYQHVAYVQHLTETGQAPRFGATSVSAVLLAEAVKFPQPEKALLGQLEPLGAKGYRSFWDRPDVQDPAAPAEIPAGRRIMLYQAQHSALYYRLASPFYRALGGASDLRSSMAGLRLLNLAMMAAAVWISLRVVRNAVARERDAALIGLAISAHPLFLMNGTRVANDALGVLLAAGAIASCVSLLNRQQAGWLILRGLATGALIGLAILAKATNYALLPFAAACVLMMRISLGPRPAPATITAAAMALGVVAVIYPEVASNLTNYGFLTPMQEAIVNRQAGKTPHDLLRAAAAMDWPGWLTQLWDRQLFFVGGWSFRAPEPTVILTYRNLVMIGLLGWVWLAAMRICRGGSKRASVFSTSWHPVAGLILVLSYSMALAYHRVQSQLAWGESSTCAWYASAALPCFLMLVVAGSLHWPTRRVAEAIPLGLAGVSVAAEILGIFGKMIPWYTACAPWNLSMRRLAALQPPWLGTPTLALAIASEIVVLAMLVLVWRDDLLGRHRRIPKSEQPRRGQQPHFQGLRLDPAEAAASRNLFTISAPGRWRREPV
jgi:hypothetical protein